LELGCAFLDYLAGNTYFKTRYRAQSGFVPWFQLGSPQASKSRKTRFARFIDGLRLSRGSTVDPSFEAPLDAEAFSLEGWIAIPRDAADSLRLAEMDQMVTAPAGGQPRRRDSAVDRNLFRKAFVASGNGLWGSDRFRNQGTGNVVCCWLIAPAWKLKPVVGRMSRGVKSAWLASGDLSLEWPWCWEAQAWSMACPQCGAQGETLAMGALGAAGPRREFSRPSRNFAATAGSVESERGF